MEDGMSYDFQMDLPQVTFRREDYAETGSGHKICVNPKGLICGTQNIVLFKTIVLKDVILRGDLSSIRIGKFTTVKNGSIIRPSHKKYSKGVTMFPVHIGDHVMIDENCLISAAQILSFVHVGAGSVIGGGAIIKECCRILPNSVIVPESVFPPFSTIAGNPAKVIGREPECTEFIMTDVTKQFYENFVLADSSRILS